MRTLAEDLPSPRVYEGFHFIYALKCPKTGEIRYIGRANNPRLRYTQHRNAQSRKGRNSPATQWITELRSEGLSPLMAILETIQAAPPYNESIGKQREKVWIAKYLENGASLLNIYARPEPSYLSDYRRRALGVPVEDLVREN